MKAIRLGRIITILIAIWLTISIGLQIFSPLGSLMALVWTFPLFGGIAGLYLFIFGWVIKELWKWEKTLWGTQPKISKMEDVQKRIRELERELGIEN